MWSRFLFPQTLNGFRISSVTHQVVSTNTFHGDNASGFKQMDATIKRCHIRFFDTFFIDKREPWTTNRAGYRFRVETPVQWIFVFEAALRAQFKSSHGRTRPVIGQSLDQGVSRTTLRAIDKRIMVAAIIRIIQFREAFGASEIISGYVDIREIISRAWQDTKFLTRGGYNDI